MLSNRYQLIYESWRSCHAMIDSSRVALRIDDEGRGKRKYSPRIGEMRILKRLHLDDLKPLAVLSRNLFERGILDR